MSIFVRSDATKWGITLLIPALIMITPVSETYTADMRVFLAITALAMLMMMFEFFDDLIPALIIPFGYALSGITTLDVAFSGWSNTLIYMIMGAFVLANIMDENNFLKRIAYWVMIKVGNSFTNLLWGLFAACALVPLVSFGNAFPIIGTMAYGLTRALNLPKGKASAAIVLVCCLAGVSIRSWIYSPLLIGLLQPLASNVLGPDFRVYWYHEMGYNITYLITILFMTWFVIKTFKPEVEIKSREYFIEEYRKLGPMTVNEKKIAFITIVIMIFLLTSPIHKIDCNWAFIIFPYVLYLPGFNVGTRSALINVNWSMITFIVSCFGIGVVAKDLGFGEIISNYFTPVMQGFGFYPSTIIIYVLSVILNFFMTPYAIFSTIVVPFITIAIDMNINPMAWLMTMTMGVDQISFPYEYPAYLCIYGFGMCKMTEFIKIYSMKTIVSILVFAVFTIPSWMLFGVMFTN